MKNWSSDARSCVTATQVRHKHHRIPLGRSFVVREEGTRIGEIEKEEIGLCVANPPNHAWANGDRCQITAGSDPDYPDAPIGSFGGPPIIAGNHDPNVHGILQPTTNCAEMMALHSPQVGGVELIDLEHPQSVGVAHSNRPE